MFFENNFISKIIFKENVLINTIEGFTFSGSKLININLELLKNLEKIDAYAFQDCKMLIK